MPKRTDLVLLLANVGRLGQVHFSAGVVEPLPLDVLQVVPVGVLVKRIDGGEDLRAEGALEAILRLRRALRLMGGTREKLL